MRKLLTTMWASDVGLTGLLAVLFLQIFVFYPLADSAMGRTLVYGMFFLLLISGILTVIGTHIWAKLVIILASLSLIPRFIGFFHESPHLVSINALMGVLFSALLITVILMQVFREGPVNAHRIAGSVAAYLLIGVMWGGAYLIVALQASNAFVFPPYMAMDDSHILQAKLFYFSFITLTSVGYGDIVPVHPVAQTLAMMEALVGQLFPAILLARLVSLEIEARQDKRKNETNEP
jgi:hypothetical protein